jgi:hypothetical protein
MMVRVIVHEREFRSRLVKEGAYWVDIRAKVVVPGTVYKTADEG